MNGRIPTGTRLGRAQAAMPLTAPGTQEIVTEGVAMVRLGCQTIYAWAGKEENYFDNIEDVAEMPPHLARAVILKHEALGEVRLFPDEARAFANLLLKLAGPEPTTGEPR